jgi:hypothetical protein
VSSIATNKEQGVTLPQAALIAGFGYLLMPVVYAEFSIYPKLVIPGNIEQTVHNIVAHQRLFALAILCYLITFIEDVVIAWALYVLLVPVNRALSLLTAWFRLVYTAMALFALLHLVSVYRLLTTPDYLTLFGSGPLHAQVQLLLNSFRYDWSMSLVIFGIHLVLLGCLIFRSTYIPKILGILLANRRSRLGHHPLATLPLSERPSWVLFYGVPRGTVLAALALDPGLEDPGTEDAFLSCPVYGMGQGAAPSFSSAILGEAGTLPVPYPARQSSC